MQGKQLFADPELKKKLVEKEKDAAEDKKEIAIHKMRIKELEQEKKDFLKADKYETLEEQSQKAKHLDPSRVGRTADSCAKDVKRKTAARIGKKQVENARREGLRARTRSQTNRSD